MFRTFSRCRLLGSLFSALAGCLVLPTLAASSAFEDTIAQRTLACTA